MFICVKNYIDCREPWTDYDFEMIAVEVKVRDTKIFLGNCRDLQSSKRGHAGYRKISNPNWLYKEFYKA